MAKIYISSTYGDLQPYRERVHAIVRQRRHIDVSVAGDERAPSTSLEAVKSCDLYIGIIAWKYGEVPTGYNLSITELELRCALEQRKDCLILLANPQGWDFFKIDMNRERIQALQEQLQELGGDQPAAELALRQFLTKHFSTDELTTLMHDLGGDIENLPPSGKEGQARELIGYFGRRGKLPQLIAAAKEHRPAIGLPLILYRFLSQSAHDQFVAIDTFTNEDDFRKHVFERFGEWGARRGIANEGQDTDWEIYRSEALETHRWVRLQVIASSKDLITQIPLTDIFVPQLVKGGRDEYDIPKEIHEARAKLFQLSQTEPFLEIEPDEEPASTGEELSTSDTEYYGGLTEQALEVFGRERMQVFLGGPGSGKSTLLLYAMLLLCEESQSSDHLPSHLQDAPIPFLVELRQYVTDDNTSHDLVAYIARESKRYHPVFKEGLESLLSKDGGTIILLDGLDEIFDEATRSQIKEQVKLFARKYPRAKIIVTSRIAGYEPSDLTIAGFAHYTILDFTLHQVRLFIPKWFQHYTRKDDKRDARGLIRQIENSSRLMELAGNPLLLTMMAIVYIREVLPERRWELYQRCTRVLLEDWDVIRHNLQTKLRVEIGEPEKAEILRRVAKHMLENRESGPDVNVIRSEPLMKILAEYIETGYKQAPADAGVTARQILRHLRERTYILAEIGEERFGFVHRTFMEYFAAVHYLKEFNGGGASFNYLINTIYDPHWQDDAWREVLLLLIGMLADQGTKVKKLVDHLWHRYKRTHLKNLAFAARCLAEVHKIEDQAWAGKLALELVQQIATDVQSNAQGTQASVADGLSGFTALAPFIEMPAEIRTVIDQLQLNAKSVRERMVAWQIGFAMRSHEERLAYAIGALADRQEAVRRGAIAALEREWPGNEQARRALVEIVREGQHSRVRQAALEALARAWPTNADILDAIEARAEMETAYTYVIEVIRYLAATWSGNRRAFKIITKLADPARTAVFDQYFPVAYAAAARFGESWRGHPEALPWVYKLVSHQDAQVRSSVLSAVGRHWRDELATLPWLQERAVSDGDQQVRLRALQVVADGWRDNLTLLPWFQERALNDDAPQVRANAVRAVGQSWQNDPAILSWLQQRAISDEAPLVRINAVQTVWQGWRDYPTILSWLQQRARDDGDSQVRIRALQAVADGWRDDPATLPWFFECAVQDNASQVRTQAVQTIAANWGNNLATLSWLQERALNDDVPQVRASAIQAVAAAWRNDPTTFSSFLADTISDNNAQTRLAALLVATYPQSIGSPFLSIRLRTSQRLSWQYYYRWNLYNSNFVLWTGTPEERWLDFLSRTSGEISDVYKVHWSKPIRINQEIFRDEVVHVLQDRAKTDPERLLRLYALVLLLEIWLPDKPTLLSFLQKRAVEETDTLVRDFLGQFLANLED